MKRESGHFLNRELSWLEFNGRVLEEACDPRVPLLERLGFLAITASNLDEFFMVRVGGLELLLAGGRDRRDPAGLTPAGQLEAVLERVRRMTRDQDACARDLFAALAGEGLVRLSAADLDAEQAAQVQETFRAEALPVLTPMALHPRRPFPLLVNLGLYAAVRLAPGGGSRRPRVALLPLAAGLPRFLTLPVGRGRAFLPIEEAVASHAGLLFPGQAVEEVAPFRVTRNAAVDVADDFAEDLVKEMQEVLEERRGSGCVRLEIAASASSWLVEYLRQALGLRTGSVFRPRVLLDPPALREWAARPGYESLHYPSWPAAPSVEFDPARDVFGQVAQRPRFLFHPYESFDPVVRFVEEAARDPRVLSIKQTLYRVSPESPIVAALRAAAAAGKYVTVVVELKARFDEARNIGWARALEEAGVQVIYGVRGLKTHAKICLVTRREERGLVRYCHFGTGNYNERTARLYSDAGYFTADPDLASDASALLNAVCGFSEPPRMLKLRAAPFALREELEGLIRAEAQRSRQGQKAQILAKMNSLSDPGIIDELYRASAAGVKIRLAVRGICCLRPGVRGLSENIRVASVVDRYLEHARLFCFHNGGAPRMFLSSADWMTRNLDRRVELLVPVEDPACRRRMLWILETSLADDAKARALRSDGRYDPPAGGRRRSQREFHDWARNAGRDAQRARRTLFEPHRSPRVQPGERLLQG